MIKAFNGLRPFNLRSVIASKPSLIQQAISVLRRFGLNAHIYLPGVGMLNGLTAANYLDSAGTTAGTVDQPVGLVLDAAGSLGVELCPDVGCDNPAKWSKPAGVTVSGGTINAASPAQYSGAAVIGAAAAIGKTYIVIFEIKNWVAGRVKHICGGAAGTVSNTGNGTFTSIVTATTTGETAYFQFTDVATNLSIDNVRIQEVTGIAASQPTTSAKPILRRDAGGRYYWQFDGSNDSLSLGGPLFQMADDHCVVAGFSWNGGGVNKTVFEPAGALLQTSARVSQIGIENATNVIQAQWVTDALTVVALKDSVAVQIGAGYVVSATSRGADLVLRKNGSVRASGTKPSGATTVIGATIGNRGTASEYLNGAIYPVIAIKGTVTDPDLLLLEKLVGQLSGVQI